jgi:hypothetical protein
VKFSETFYDNIMRGKLMERGINGMTRKLIPSLGNEKTKNEILKIKNTN